MVVDFHTYVLCSAHQEDQSVGKYVNLGTQVIQHKTLQAWDVELGEVEGPVNVVIILAGFSQHYSFKVNWWKPRVDDLIDLYLGVEEIASGQLKAASEAVQNEAREDQPTGPHCQRAN